LAQVDQPPLEPFHTLGLGFAGCLPVVFLRCCHEMTEGMETIETRNADGARKDATESTQLLKQRNNGTATGAQLMLNIVVCGLGTGLFTLPWSVAGASCFLGVAIVAFVLALNAWTIFLLVEAAEAYQAFDIGSLLSHLPGQLGHTLPRVVNFTIWVGGFFCLVSYVIVIADCAAPFAQLGPWRLKTLASLLVFPLCFLDQRWLSMTSSMSVGAVAVVFWLLLQLSHDTEAFPSLCLAGVSWGTVSMFASMMQTVILQMCVLPMYGEMKDRSPGSFERVVFWSFLILFKICACFAVLGYMIFGPDVKSNVLLSLPASFSGKMARLCAGASVMGVYPLILKSMIATFHSPGHSSRAETVHFGIGAIVAAVLLTSLCLSDLGKLNIVNGAVSTGVFVAVVPFMVGLHLLERVQQSIALRLGLFLLLIFGVLGSLFALLLDDNYERELSAACFWKKNF